MLYTATVSSKGQVTIPVEERRKLGLTRRVIFERVDEGLLIRKEPTIEQIRAILDRTSTGRGLSEREKNSPAVKAALARYERNRGR